MNQWFWHSAPIMKYQHIPINLVSLRGICMYVTIGLSHCWPDEKWAVFVTIIVLDGGCKRKYHFIMRNKQNVSSES